MATDPTFTPLEAAAYVKRSPITLAGWRSHGVGPVYLKVGRVVHYRKSDLDAFIVLSQTPIVHRPIIPAQGAGLNAFLPTASLRGA